METRRTFLQRLAVTAAAMSLDPFGGVTIADDRWSNARASVSLRRPPGWEYSSVADFAALRDRQVLEDVWDRAEPHPLKDPGNLPILLVENPTHRDGDFAPGIALYDEPLMEPVPADEPAAHDRMVRRLGAVYRDVRPIRRAERRPLDGADGSVAVWSYDHVLDSGHSYQLLVRSLLVFRAPRVHTFYFIDSLTTPRIDVATFDACIDSIRYGA